MAEQDASGCTPPQPYAGAVLEIDAGQRAVVETEGMVVVDHEVVEVWIEIFRGPTLGDGPTVCSVSDRETPQAAAVADGHQNVSVRKLRRLHEIHPDVRCVALYARDRERLSERLARGNILGRSGHGGLFDMPSICPLWNAAHMALPASAVTRISSGLTPPREATASR